MTASYARVMFDIPSDNEPRVGSQRTQQCTVTMKQSLFCINILYLEPIHSFLFLEGHWRVVYIDDKREGLINNF